MENEITLLNCLLTYSHNVQHSPTLLVRNLDLAFQELPDRSTNVNIERLCEQLYQDRYFYKQSLHPNTGNETIVYSISTKGILLFEGMPDEYKTQPYTYHLYLVSEEVKVKKEKEELERDSIKANIGVAKSVKETNTKTETFYDKQHGVNVAQKNLAMAITFATIVSTIIAGLAYSDNRVEKISLQKLQTNLKKLESDKEKYQKIDSLFQKEIRDSLKSISERTK